MRTRYKGIMISEVAFPNLPVLLKNCGFDFFILDNEHGGFDYSDVSKILMTAKLVGITPVVRLADNSRMDITKFADMGAGGFLLPQTDTAEQISEVVKYAKYAPVGKRGISTMRAHTLYDPPEITGYIKTANETIKIFAQIETAKGVENISDILSVDGVDGFLMGPNDLSCDYGCLGEKASDKILRAIEITSERAARAGKICGIITSDGTYLEKGAACGMTVFSVGSELNLLTSAGKATVERINNI